MTRSFLLVVGALALTACEARSDFAPRGHFMDWHGGGGYELFAVAGSDADQLALTRGPIASDGSFALPAALAPPDRALMSAGQLYFPRQCQSVPTLEPAHFGMVTIELGVQGPDGKVHVAAMADARAGGVLGDALVYSDSEASAVGSLDCPQLGVPPVTYAVRLAHGYNLMRSLPAAASASAHEWYGTIDLPHELLLAVTLN
jgi:hypothetical protein